MSGVKQFAVDAGVIIYLDHALSARQSFADYDYRLTGLENAVDHSGWRDFAVERGSYPVAAVIFLASIMVPTLK